jgi:hypothetical protein
MPLLSTVAWSKINEVPFRIREYFFFDLDMQLLFSELDANHNHQPNDVYDYYYGHNIADQGIGTVIEKVCCQIGNKSLNLKKFH